MRLIADGVVDREGVSGLARRLAYSERQLHRLLVTELGAGPLALGPGAARADRARAHRDDRPPLRRRRVRVGVREHPPVQRHGPRGVRDDAERDARARHRSGRARQRHGPAGGPAAVRRAPSSSRSSGRAPSPASRRSTAARTGDRSRSRTATPCSRSRPAPDAVTGTFRLDDLRDLTAAVARTRRLFDLDADPVAIDAALRSGSDAAPARPPAARPAGPRPPGRVRARRAGGGRPAGVGGRGPHGPRPVRREVRQAARRARRHHHPRVPRRRDRWRRSTPASCRCRRRAPRRCVGVAAAFADGRVVVDPGVDREELRARLLALPGIGPWTVEYVLMRAVGDPDAFLASDLGVRRALEAPWARRPRPRPPPNAPTGWSPWRAYANAHLWASEGMDP